MHPGSGLVGYRSALRIPPFRTLWVAAVVSRAGDAVLFTALPVYAFAASGSAAVVAGLVAVEGVALVVGGVTAPLVVDRVPPRRLLIAADAGRMAATAALAAAPGLPAAFAVAAVLAVGTAWFSPTSMALVPRLVDVGTLHAANALQWSAGVAPQLLAAPLGGVLAGTGWSRLAFAVDALSFGLSALILTGLPAQPALAAGVGAWRQIPEALRALPRLPLLPPLLVMQAAASLAAGGPAALLVVLAERAYGLGGTGFGAWLAAIAVGALAGPLVVPWLTRLPPARTVSSAYAVRGAGDVALAALSQGAAGGVLLAVYGLNTSSGGVAFRGLVQLGVPAELRGRAFALLDVVWQVARLLSIAAAGALAATAGIRVVFAAGGCLLLLTGAYGWLALPAVGEGAGDPAAGRPEPAAGPLSRT